MAHDLLRGKTRRDWSCGIDVPLFMTEARRREAGEDVLASQEVGQLGKLVDSEIQQSFSKIAKLNAAGKMPPTLRRSFRPLLARWQEFKTVRRAKFAGSDYLDLVNFRDENRRFAQKLAPISSLVSAPSSASPGGTTTSPSIALAAAGLVGLCGLSILSRRSSKNHS